MQVEVQSLVPFTAAVTNAAWIEGLLGVSTVVIDTD